MSDPKQPTYPNASPSEGRPDYANASADIAPVAPTATSASPDLPERMKPPVQLSGASLQPIEGLDPEGGEPGDRDPAAKDA